MLSVHAAQQRILAHFPPIEKIYLPLERAAGHVLAAPIHADSDLPPFDNSSVDGFVVHAGDVAAASEEHPVILPVMGDIPAGTQPTFTLQPGQAARIMTGAPLPTGAEAVVMVEDTDHNQRKPGTAAPQQVSIYQPVKTGNNIRRRGTDLQKGAEVLLPGQRLRPQDIGMLAMVGVANAPVYRRPRVAVLSSGDEIIPVEAALAPGKIRDTNTYTLAALAAKAGCEVIRLGVAADTREAVEKLFAAAVEVRPDVIISSAGVSVGAFDYVKDVVASNGSLDFWKVNMRPGKPLAFGEYRGIPYFGLPGNPVSAFVGFLVFVEPALEQLSGLQTVERPRVSVFLGEAVESDGRESYLRAVIRLEDGRRIAHLTGNQNSGNLFSLVQANALLIIPSGVKSCPLETKVDAWLLEI
jgi:molybdopterin molybdotransferase